MPLTDREIEDYLNQDQIIINPYSLACIQPASYDLHLGPELKQIQPPKDGYIKLDTKQEWWETTTPFLLGPGQTILGHTQEWITLNDHLCAQVAGRSSVARLGLQVHCAGWVDPGFHGQITLELTNLSKYPIKLQEDMPIAQLVFFSCCVPAARPYGSPGLGSLYQGQKGAQESLIHEKSAPWC